MGAEGAIDLILRQFRARTLICSCVILHGYSIRQSQSQSGGVSSSTAPCSSHYGNAWAHVLDIHAKIQTLLKFPRSCNADGDNESAGLERHDIDDGTVCWSESCTYECYDQASLHLLLLL